MQISPVGGNPSLEGLLPTNKASSAGSHGGGFGALLDGLVGQVSAQQQVADQAVLDVAAGRSTELHNVTLAVAKADLSFRLFLEIRNRLMEAYQEVTRMQV